MWKKLKKELWQWRGVLVTAPTMAAVVILIRFSGLLQSLELSAYDQLFNFRPDEQAESPIVIVEIEESDIKNLGEWPAPDGVFAKLLENIKAQKPKAIGLDMYRDLPVQPNHEDLVKVFETTPNLIGVQKVLADANSSAVAPPPELQERNQVGANDLVLDPDGKIRRTLISVPPVDGKKISSLSMRLASIYLQAKGINPQSLGNSQVQWGKALFTPFKGNDGGYVRAADGGYQIMLNYLGHARRIPMISMTDVLENRIPPEIALRDRIVLIGASAESLKDLFYTPYSSNLMGIPERMPGVEVHANAISQIVSAVEEGRPLIKTWNPVFGWLWILVWSLVGASLSWTQRFSQSSEKRSLLYPASLLLACGSLLIGSYLAFLGGWWIPVVPPLLALTGSAVAITAYTARTAGEIRKTFGRYLTDQVVANLLETPEGLKLGGDRRKVTIVMTDLRGFSAVSERLSPEKVVNFLNIYLGIMADVITDYNGTIDEFIGDAILVIFGAPTQREDDAQRAVACAVAMQLAMENVNQQIKHLEIPDLEMGIGINTGEVVVGNIGSQKRAKYGVVGSHVNLTGRVESYTVGGQILISEYTLQDAGPIFRIDGQMQVEPKGIKHLITLYDIGGVMGNYNIFLPERENKFVTLKSPTPLQYTILEGKHVVGTICEGSIVKLSETGAEVSSKTLVPLLSNIKIVLLSGKDQDENLGDLYAKVMSKPENNETNFYIRFTAIPPDVAALISDLVAQNTD